MQSDRYFYPKKAVPPFANQTGDAYKHAPCASALDAVLPSGVQVQHLTPLPGVEFQPSEVCPKNFVIFDQTDHRSQIMFHPAIAYKFSSPSLNFCANYTQDFEKKIFNQIERESSPPLEEDPDDIDALLSLEEDEEEYDEEEVSTARTHEHYESISDTCSSYCSKSRMNRISSSIQKPTGSSSGCTGRKHHEMKRMIRVLRGVVPGGKQMNTVAVLDEAVSYLKSLKVEVQKLGVANLEN
ncbi:transcription factor bHLH [Quillaja saponaria]|uniref:Transcription factor bHLH n=1 Tax=Quillaja saponaria TaxID=32244 RepID=A0AAD7PV06_QUISA|nr:transcription factor bHLH [Quillaja saponaria]